MKKRKPSPVGCDPWYLTWSCGHRALLEESLSKTEWPRDRILVVDYSCPENAGEWVETAKMGKVLRVDARRLADGTPLVSRAQALNAGLAKLRGEFVLVGDPQLYPTSATRTLVSAQGDASPESVVVSSDTSRTSVGIVVARAETLLSVGGYLSAYVGHGAEAIDLRLRMIRHSVTIVTMDLGLGVATGHKARIWGSGGLLERRLGLLYSGPITEASKLLAFSM